MQNELPRPQYVTLHGHEIRYWQAGEGPALLLIHGMAGSATTWKPVMAKLAKQFTVIAPDLIGHGKSDKPMTDYSLGNFAAGMRDFLVAVGIERATVVGHSLGGGVAMQMAYQHPERVERLVLVGSGGLGREVNVILRMLTLPGAEYLMPVLFNHVARDVGNRVSLFLRNVGLRAPEAQETWRAYVSLTEPQNRASFVRTLRAVIDLGGQSVSAHDRLYLASHMPTMILWGARDRIIPVSHAHAAQEAMPGSRLEIFDESGHFLHCEEPDKFVDALVDFVGSTPVAEIDPDSWRLLLTD